MKMRPILFSGEMVRAILDGRKTQTRRVIKPQPDEITGDILQPYVWYAADKGDFAGDPDRQIKCPYGKLGDRLWVREAYHQHYQGGVLGGRPCYRADGPCSGSDILGWKPSIHMPRWASRITLEITDIHVERVQEIGEEDAKAEGVRPIMDMTGDMTHEELPKFSELFWPSFRDLWNSINAKRGYSWKSNPFVWVISFKRVDQGLTTKAG